MNIGTDAVPKNRATHVEVRRLVSQDLRVMDRFFVEVLGSGIDRAFHPHPFDSQMANYVCSYDGLDWYGGCFVRCRAAKQMVGYVMLRGWDAGYTVPSLGVCVLPHYQNLGIGRLLLSLAVLVARFRGSPAIRLKAYPENKAALALYKRAGFAFEEGLEEMQLVGYLQLRETDRDPSFLP